MKYILKELEDTLKISAIANIHFFEFPQAFYTNAESHPFYELIFISRGKLSVISDSYNGVLEKNDLIIHRPGEKHYLKCDKSNAPTVIIIGFSCSTELLLKFSTIPTPLNDASVRQLAEIIKEGRNVFAPPYDVPKYDMKKKENPTFGSEQLLKNLLEYFLITLTRKTMNELTSDELLDIEGPLDRIVANEIIAYIDGNYKERITIDELSFIFRTNRSTLCKVFKSNTGKTITEYINDKKFNEAKRRIEKTNKTFTEIAEELNFESVHYFTKFFKKRSKQTPSEYKKSLLSLKI